MNLEILLGGGGGTQMDYGYTLFTIGLEFDWSILTSCFAGLGLKIIYFLFCKIAITTKQAERYVEAIFSPCHPFIWSTTVLKHGKLASYNVDSYMITCACP